MPADSWQNPWPDVPRKEKPMKFYGRDDGEPYFRWRECDRWEGMRILRGRKYSGDTVETEFIDDGVFAG